VWDVEDEEKGVIGEILQRTGRLIDLGWAIWNIAHHYVLTNTIAMVVWVKCWINIGYQSFYNCQ
jgi:hypothetical protein